ncbi:TPA: restriction endonuclease subunit S [Campylobacter coli]|nr:restriction endonuclease subunit S [Campylobacter coli]
MTNLPQGWEKFNFDNIFYSPSSKNYQLNTKDYLEKGCIPIIDQSKKFIIGYSNDYEKVFKINNCNNSCIIFGDHTRVLKFIDFDFIVGADGVKILLNKDIERFNTKFLFFQLLYKDIPLLGYRRHFSVLKQSTFSIPPLKEQERIVGILDESFAKIDESIKILEQDLLNLDELMQSALQKAFNPLKDNVKENYKLPQSWEWKSLGEIGEIITGTTPSKNNPNFYGNEYPLFKPSDLNGDIIIKYASDNLSKLGFDNARNLPKNTILIVCIGASIGKVGLSGANGSCNQQINAIIPNSKFLPKFLFFLCSSNYFQEILKNNASQATLPIINKTEFSKLQIPLPPIKEQEQITSHLDELSSHVKNLKQNYQAQIKDLQELKNSLLDKAFKGKL